MKFLLQHIWSIFISPKARVSFCLFVSGRIYFYACARSFVTPFIAPVFSDWIENRQINKWTNCMVLASTDFPTLLKQIRGHWFLVWKAWEQLCSTSLFRTALGTFKCMLKSPWFQSASLTASSALNAVSVLLEYLMPLLMLL